MSNQKLTTLVHRYLKEKGLKATTAKTWRRHQGKLVGYWWNYFYVDGIWWGINVYDDDTVKRIV